MFKRIANVISGWFSGIVRWFESKNPEALIENEQEEVRKRISQYNTTLASQASFIERLKRQVRDLKNTEMEYDAKIKANLKAGNKRVAGQLALQLKNIRWQLEENTAQLEEQEALYQAFEADRTKMIEDSKTKIAQLKHQLTETEMYEAHADMKETAAKLKGQMISPSDDGIARISSILEDRRDRAAGRARVASSASALSLGDSAQLEMKEAEMDALADAALSEYLGLEDSSNHSATKGELPAPEE
ncbi:MAG: hypothetical protein GX221_04770 [Candidatus Riflebacteria bacterium]|nr:hypothetical protein [Candidatus Riflebacteria bacterium]